MNDGHEEQPVELGGLYGGRTPPPDLEQRVVADYNATVRERARRSQQGRPPRWRHMIAAALLLFLGGVGVGRMLGGGAPGETAAGSEPAAGERRAFMLVLWEDSAGGAAASPEGVAEEYARWAHATAEQGVAISGHELGADRLMLAPEPPAGPVPPEEFRIGGYFIIEAPDARAARAIAEGHPHLARGGWIEIAELLQ